MKCRLNSSLEHSGSIWMMFATSLVSSLHACEHKTIYYYPDCVLMAPQYGCVGSACK